MRQPRALITGLSSSLAYGAALALKSIGFHVIGVTRNLSSVLEVTQETVNWIDPKSWPRKSFTHPFDFVLHTAAQGPASTVESHYQVNCEIPLNFFSQLEFFPWTKFVFTSTTSVYTPRVGEVINEFTIPNPGSEYALSKLAFENAIPSVLLSRGSEGHALVLRLPTLLGRKVSSNLIHRWCEIAVKNQSIHVRNPDEKFDAVVSEEDVIRRILSETKQQIAIKYVVNCHSNGDITFLESAKLVSSFLNGPAPMTIEDSSAIPTHLTNINEHTFANISTRFSLTRYLRMMGSHI